MAFTAEQEAYLAKIADAALDVQAYEAKVKELDAARVAAQDACYFKHEAAIKGSTGQPQRDAIAALQAEIAADPEVARLESEALILRNSR